MSKRMTELLAMSSLAMAMASVGESPARMPRKPAYVLTNKEKKKCKSCVYCGKVAGLLQCDIYARSRIEMNPLNPACSKYKKRKK